MEAVTPSLGWGVLHLYYRVDRVNGGPVQMTILIASALGVVMGAVTNRRRMAATA